MNARSWRLRGAALVLLGVLLALAGCSTVQPPPAPPSYTATQLLALRPADLQWAATSDAGEQAQREADLARLRSGLALPDGPERLAALPGLLDLAAHYDTEIDTARPMLLAALPNLPALDANTQRALLTAAHTLYPQEAAPLVEPLLPQLPETKPFAIAAYTLLAARVPGVEARLRERIPQQFPQWRDDARLTALMQRLDSAAPQHPPLAELLAAPLRPGYPVVFSLQRPGRQHIGLALVRAPDGRFLREANGELLAIPQLALARSGLPGTITNGNTPQGLFTIVGSSVAASNPTIGPTPFLHSKLPIEATVAEFEHTARSEAWSEAVYDSFLPPAWQAYAPFKEAWLAGRAGRDEILAHGSVVRTEAYHPAARFLPGTPSAGCLVAPERWDASTGRLLSSQQLRLAQAYAGVATESLAGYLVVVEVDAADGPVTPGEALAWVQAAEALRSAR
jgi:hypothetical protein